MNVQCIFLLLQTAPHRCHITTQGHLRDRNPRVKDREGFCCNLQRRTLMRCRDSHNFYWTWLRWKESKYLVGIQRRKYHQSGDGRLLSRVREEFCWGVKFGSRHFPEKRDF